MIVHALSLNSAFKRQKQADLIQFKASERYIVRSQLIERKEKMERGKEGWKERGREIGKERQAND